ncbi:response regulator [Undibacterium sp. Di26W]|uniref:response regulator n=1 Tax=Undibacterium sp. Di26W TaxID=3413035 RepID=UPI003BF4546A
MHKPDFSKLTFLIVDDISAMRQVAAGQLRALGAEQIQVAGNGLEALQILRRSKIDVVLTDWNMPVMDGLELLRAVRVDPKLVDLPLIMVTAEVERDRVAEAVRNGVSDLLVKPYTAQRMEDKIVGALRRSRSPAAPEPVTTETPKPAQLPSILVVDDTHLNLRLIADLFADEYRVRIADNGKRALTICQSDNPPDLVLLDVMMPEMDGFEVAQKMREHPNSELIPVIFVTALSDDNSRRKGFDLGAVDFVSKPIDPEILQVRVRNFIRYVEMHKQRQQEYDTMLVNARLRENVDRMLRHDIRGPLAGVIGLLQDFPDDGQLGAQQARRLSEIEAAAVQALDTISLSSDLFKIETGRYQLEPVAVDIGRLLQQVLQLVQSAFAVRQLVFVDEIHLTANASGDPVLCHAIFHNLLKNACEAAPEGGRIKLSLHEESPLRIVIENTGAVPASMLDRFFDRGATAGKTGGSGLGTYSAKLLTEAQGGTIAMDSHEGENITRLTVCLLREPAVA